VAWDVPPGKNDGSLSSFRISFVVVPLTQVTVFADGVRQAAQIVHVEPAEIRAKEVAVATFKFLSRPEVLTVRPCVAFPPKALAGPECCVVFAKLLSLLSVRRLLRLASAWSLLTCTAVV
jgi:hypothetical protein